MEPSTDNGRSPFLIAQVDALTDQIVASDRFSSKLLAEKTRCILDEGAKLGYELALKDIVNCRDAQGGALWFYLMRDGHKTAFKKVLPHIEASYDNAVDCASVPGSMLQFGPGAQNPAAANPFEKFLPEAFVASFLSWEPSNANFFAHARGDLWRDKISEIAANAELCIREMTPETQVFEHTLAMLLRSCESARAARIAGAFLEKAASFAEADPAYEYDPVPVFEHLRAMAAEGKPLPPELFIRHEGRLGPALAKDAYANSLIEKPEYAMGAFKSLILKFASRDLIFKGVCTGYLSPEDLAESIGAKDLRAAAQRSVLLNCSGLSAPAPAKKTPGL